jgi:DNA-binding MarR family transcriptional regulator
VKPSDLTPRQGKTLRYIVSHNKLIKQEVTPEMCIVTIEWSDLSHTKTQAAATISALRKKGLVERGKEGYKPTEAGIALMAAADKKGRWNAPPARAKTNKRRNTK